MGKCGIGVTFQDGHVHRDNAFRETCETRRNLQKGRREEECIDYSAKNEQPPLAALSSILVGSTAAAAAAVEFATSDSTAIKTLTASGENSKRATCLCHGHKSQCDPAKSQIKPEPSPRRASLSFVVKESLGFVNALVTFKKCIGAAVTATQKAPRRHCSSFRRFRERRG